MSPHSRCLFPYIWYRSIKVHPLPQFGTIPELRWNWLRILLWIITDQFLSLFTTAFICSHSYNLRRTCICFAISKVFLLEDSTSNISICDVIVGIKQVLSVWNIAVRRACNSVVYLFQLLSFCPALCCDLFKTCCYLPRFALWLVLMGWWDAAAVLLMASILFSFF